MPTDKVSVFVAYARMIASSAPERATQYSQDAERLRQMAETQRSDERQSRLDIAKLYEDLANKVVPKQKDGT